MDFSLLGPLVAFGLFLLVVGGMSSLLGGYLEERRLAHRRHVLDGIAADMGDEWTAAFEAHQERSVDPTADWDE